MKANVGEVWKNGRTNHAEILAEAKWDMPHVGSPTTCKYLLLYVFVQIKRFVHLCMSA
jgi:hypothetical protein